MKKLISFMTLFCCLSNVHSIIEVQDYDCQKSLTNMKSILTGQTDEPQYSPGFTPMNTDGLYMSSSLEGPAKQFVEKSNCKIGIHLMPPVFHDKCFEGNKSYVRSAFEIFTDDINDGVNSLFNLIDDAQQTRLAAAELFDSIRKMIQQDLLNQSLDDGRKTYYRDQLKVFGQSQYACHVMFGNQLTGLKILGNSLSRFLPYLEGEEDIIAANLGYETIDEVFQLKDFFLDYGKDLNDAPLEIEEAQKEIDMLNGDYVELMEIVK